jgi:Glyoxalase-like domain
VLSLDHVIVAVRGLARAQSDWESRGLVATDSGVHPQVGTRNALVRFPDRSFLELMAIDDREKLRSYAPALLEQLDRSFEGPFSWALRTDNIEQARANLVNAGFDALPIWPGEARRDSGSTARWRSLHIREPGFPFLVQYDTEPSSEPSRRSIPVTGLGAVLLSGPPEVLTRLGRAFGARPTNGHVEFDGGGVRLIGSASTVVTIAGVELVSNDSERAKRMLRGDEEEADGLKDPRLHGLVIELASRSKET